MFANSIEKIAHPPSHSLNFSVSGDEIIPSVRYLPCPAFDLVSGLEEAAVELLCENIVQIQIQTQIYTDATLFYNYKDVLFPIFWWCGTDCVVILGVISHTFGRGRFALPRYSESARQCAWPPIINPRGTSRHLPKCQRLGLSIPDYTHVLHPQFS